MHGTTKMHWKRRLKLAVKPLLKPVLDAMPHALQFHLFGRWRTPQTHDYLTAAQTESARAEIIRVMSGFRAQADRPVYWFLPSQTWFSGSFQRPQQLARALAETGCGIIYFEEWQVNHMVHLADQGIVAKGTVQTVEPNLVLSRCPPALIAKLVDELAPEALILLWPGQESSMPDSILKDRDPDAPGRTLVVYEVVDDPSLQPDADAAWHATHAKWLSKADLVTVTADDLLHQVAAVRNDALLLPNGVRLEDWRGGTKAQAPDDLSQAVQASLVVGYYGALASWFDWDMWLGAARARPDWAFVLIGYPYLDEDSVRIEAAIRLPNVHYLGKKPNRDLAAYLDRFDVATIPFILNDITHACSPVKLFEYLAGGKPVVSTSMREILKYHSIYLADDTSGFVAAIEQAAAEAKTGKKADLIRSEADANTWRSRATTLRVALEARGSRSPSCAERADAAA